MSAQEYSPRRCQGKEESKGSLRLGGNRSGARSRSLPERRKENSSYSDVFVEALERTFQINGSVPHACPRCCGRKPKRTIRPFPTPTSASAICPLSFSSPSSQPDRSTFSFA